MRYHAFEELLGQKPPARQKSEAIYSKLGEETRRALEERMRLSRLGWPGVADEGPYDIYLCQRISEKCFREILASELDTAIGGADSTAAIARKIFEGTHPELAQHEQFIQDLSAEPWATDIVVWLQEGNLELGALAEGLLKSKPLRSQLQR